MVVEIIFTNLTDLIYLSIALIGLILIGAFYLLPKVVGEFHPLYEVIPDIVMSYPEASSEVEVHPGRMRAGELIILIPKGASVDEDLKDILLNAGFARGIIEGLCRSMGCSLRIIINKKKVISCLSDPSLNPFHKITERYLGKIKYVAFFNETGMRNAIERCLKDELLISSDLAYKEGLLDYLPLDSSGKREKVYMIFSNSSFQINLILYKGTVRAT